MRRLFRVSLERLRWLWDKARNENATPRQVAIAAALGAFIGATPIVGFRGWVALGAATLFRLNRLFCWIGCKTSNFLTTAFITYAEVQIAHRLRTGAWLALSPEEALTHADTVLADWCLGTIPVGLALALITGASGYGLARVRDARRARKAAQEAQAA